MTSPFQEDLRAAAAAPAPGLDRAGPADLSELEALERQCFDGSLALKRRQLRYLLRSPRVSARVVRRDGRIAAEVMVLRRKTPRGLIGRIYTLAVDAAYRGNGLGRMVLAGCLDELRAEGAAAAVLEVDATNDAAIALYERMGFERTRRLVDYYAAGKDAWKMRLELAGACRPSTLSRDPKGSGCRPSTLSRDPKGSGCRPSTLSRDAKRSAPPAALVGVSR